MIENTEDTNGVCERSLTKLIPDNDDNKIVQKPKRKLTEKQIEIGKANLEKGRVALAEKKKKEKEEAQKITDELIVKKAEKLVIQKEKKIKQIKTFIGDIEEVEDQKKDDTFGKPELVPEGRNPDLVEYEERIIKKPKKKRVVYRVESDSEEEVIIKSKPKSKVVVDESYRSQRPEVSKKEILIKQEPPKQMFKINFC